MGEYCIYAGNLYTSIKKHLKVGPEMGSIQIRFLAQKMVAKTHFLALGGR